MSERTKKRKLSEESDYNPSENDENDPTINKPKKKKRKISKDNKETTPKSTNKKKTPKTQSTKKKQSNNKLTKKKIQEIKKALNDDVKTLAKMVNLDWHDGYEEQGEKLCEWYENLKEPCEIIYDFAIKQKTEFEKCNELLKIMADTWLNIQAIPARSDHSEVVSNATLELDLTEINLTKKFYGTPKNVFSFVWDMFLHAAAASSSVTTQEMYRYIKDAYDNGVQILSASHEKIDANKIKNDDSKQEEQKSWIEKHEYLQQGVERLKQLYDNKEEWNKLPTTKKVHKMRRAIDRRYDGELHLRTRDYHLYDDDDANDCNIM